MSPSGSLWVVFRNLNARPKVPNLYKASTPAGLKFPSPTMLFNSCEVHPT